MVYAGEKDSSSLTVITLVVTLVFGMVGTGIYFLAKQENHMLMPEGGIDRTAGTPAAQTVTPRG